MSNPLKERLKRRLSTEEGNISPKKRRSSSSEQLLSSLEPSGSSTLNMEIEPRSKSLRKTEASTPSVLSLASNASKSTPLTFQQEHEGLKKTEASTPTVLSLASNASKYTPLTFQQEPEGPMGFVCCVCEKTSDDRPVDLMCPHVACFPCAIQATEQEIDQVHCTLCETNQKIAPNQENLQTLIRRIINTRQVLKREMMGKFSTTEGNGDERISLKLIYTSLTINFEKREIPDEHDLRQIKKQDSLDIEVDLSVLFESSSTKFVRTILTNGAAGIGKSFSVQKFIDDWAEGITTQDVHFIFCVSFRELNLIKENMSFLQLLKVFHPAVSDLNAQDFEQTKVIVILDGFDESRFHLDYHTKRVFSVEECSSVSNLMMNLIQGNLLPKAQLWITSRPAASHQIPGEFIHRVSEIQGFNDQQKEEYFNKRFRDKPDVAKMVISHIQSSPTLDLLCQIPIFCWMSSVLLEEVFGGEEQTEAPQTLTEMMGAFLFVQTKRSSRKYDQNPERDRTELLKAKRGFLLKLGKLAFIHLLENSLIFYEEDLEKCGLDFKEVTINSGFFNSVFREEQLFLQQKVFYFVHLTVQEFFAALYVYDCFTHNKVWAPELSKFLGLDHSESSKTPVFDLLKMTVDKVLQRQNGHLFFFLRFLLGLMFESNQKFIHGLLLPQESSPETVKKMLVHLKSIRRKTVSPDACINLFQSMVEMGDSKISEEINDYLKTKDKEFVLTPLHCSALAFTIQVSKSVLEEFDLKSYNTSEEGRRRLIPAVRSSRRANLSECRVSEALLTPLSLALSLPHSSLRDLDLTNTDVGDSGVKQLCEGLKSPVCKLSKLSVSGCLVTDVGCGFLVSALKSNPSYLKELDLSCNHLEASEKTLNDLKSDPQYNLSLQQINVSNGGSHRLIPGLKKYWCDLSWDTKLSQCTNVQFSDEQRKVSRSEEGPHHVLVWGKQELSGRCYWEVETQGSLNIGVMYINNESEQADFRLGQNENSWSLVCSEEGFYAFHNNQSTETKVSHCSRPSRLGIYIDHPAGVLSIFKVKAENRSLLHTFTEKFTKHLLPAADMKPKSSAKFYFTKRNERDL